MRARECAREHAHAYGRAHANAYAHALAHANAQAHTHAHRCLHTHTRTHPKTIAGATTYNKAQTANGQPSDNQTANSGHKSDTSSHAVSVSLLCALFGVLVDVGCHGR